MSIRGKWRVVETPGYDMAVAGAFILFNEDGGEFALDCLTGCIHGACDGDAVQFGWQRPAIMLDIDETSLSNWPRIFRDDYAYIPNGRCDFEKVGDPCGDLDWQQSGLAKAIAPTLKLYEYARCVGRPAPCSPIEVFFVTGRREAEHNYEMASVWTLRNLEQAG
jgi:hypothetical protein